MNLQKKSYTELQTLFEVVFRDWQANNLQISWVKNRECEKYGEFVKRRADLRQLARENAKLHDLMIRIDLEMQIRTWTGHND